MYSSVKYLFALEIDFSQLLFVQTLEVNRSNLKMHDLAGKWVNKINFAWQETYTQKENEKKNISTNRCMDLAARVGHLFTWHSVSQRNGIAPRIWDRKAFAKKINKPWWIGSLDKRSRIFNTIYFTCLYHLTLVL